MITVFLSFIFSCFLCVNSFEKHLTSENEIAYYSDYFVFISDDGLSSVIVPLDLNWKPITEGYEIEFKSWYGTEKDWPIIYKKKELNPKTGKIPKEGFEHTNLYGFQFNAQEQKIQLQIPFAPQLGLTIPNQKDWVLAPSNNQTHKKVFAARTTLQVKNKVRKGWIIYERIRWKQDEVVEFGDFEAFFWIPIVVNGNLYHFEQHRDEQFAFKWTQMERNIDVNRIETFNILITKSIKDIKSGRKEIPKEIRITAENNNFSIDLTSKGEQVGYGANFPKGLAYYRQSMLVSTKTSVLNGYGMLELILEDN